MQPNSKDKITSLDTYHKEYSFSMRDTDSFWAGIAERNYVWSKKWDKVSNCDMQQGKFVWFENAVLNITENCIDRHLATNANDVAYFFEPNNPKEQGQKITYQTLHDEVCKLANVLQNKGIQKGDRVCIYLPMIPELVYSVLACARIGAVHSVVFAGFSSGALETRLLDCTAKMVITADGGFRGEKQIPLKEIVDEALIKCDLVKNVLVVKRTGQPCFMKQGRDARFEEEMKKSSSVFAPVPMSSEDPLFILYTSGSTGKPKGMLHTCGGYMVYVGYSFKNVFQYEPGQVYWCTADVGWITGHSYIVYGPLLNRATSVLFEGIPSYPDCSRFWQVIEKYKVNQFYTAPTAIRALAKESIDLVRPFAMDSLQILGTVGEPINEEAWHWYDENVGHQKCPIVDTWWQTETGGILISPIPNCTPIKPTYATLPLPGVQPILVDNEGKEISGFGVEGNLCINLAWPSIARSIWGDHQRFLETYFTAFPGKYFTGDGAFRDEDGFYRITGRVDDVIIVSGHNLGTAPIEDAINEHSLVAESAVVGFPHSIKGNALYGFVALKTTKNISDLQNEINALISKQIGPIAKLDKIQFVSGLPKTRSGKIMRRILRKIANQEYDNFGDISTLLNPECVEEIVQGANPQLL